MLDERMHMHFIYTTSIVRGDNAMLQHMGVARVHVFASHKHLDTQRAHLQIKYAHISDGQTIVCVCVCSAGSENLK